MALTVNVSITGPAEEQQVALDALNWLVAKRVYTDSETGKKVIENPLEGMSLNDALKVRAVQLISEALEGYMQWQKSQEQPNPAPTVS